MPRIKILIVSQIVVTVAIALTVVLSPELRASVYQPLRYAVMESAATATIPSAKQDDARAQLNIRPIRVATGSGRSTPDQRSSGPEQPRARTISEAVVAAPRTTETPVGRKRTAMPYGIYVPPF